MKKCSKCKEELPETSEFFYKSKRGKNGLMAHCKKCNYKPKKAKERYEEKSEELKEKAKTYYQQNRQEVLRRRKQYRDNNRDKINANARERFHERYGVDKEWTDAFKERQMKTFTEEEWNRAKEKENNACSKCGNRGELVPNFIRPIKKGGSKTIENVQPLCRTCNQAKGEYTIDYRRNR